MSMLRKITNKEFVDRAKEVHGGKYDYSKVEYKKMHDKVCIICPEHGEFWQTPHNHLKGQDCPKCANITRGDAFRDDRNEFIRMAKKVHGDKYDYSKVEYVNNRSKICIICPVHGEFWQRPYSHLQGFGCKKCNGNVYDTTTFVNRAKEVHGDKYDYSKVEYTHSKKKVCIICPKHGEFWQTPTVHLKGGNCPNCIKENKINDFLEQSKIIHNNKYDYSKVEYVDSTTKVCIICPKHGEFWQRPFSHINGNGCPMCKESLLEEEINSFFDKMSFIVERQKRFNWLGLQSLDFYLPEYNVAVECQGIQHFDIVKNWGGNKKLKRQKELDKNKKELCEEHGIKILYFTHEDYKLFLGELLIKSTNELLRKIKKYDKIKVL